MRSRGQSYRASLSGRPGRCAKVVVIWTAQSDSSIAKDDSWKRVRLAVAELTFVGVVMLSVEVAQGGWDLKRVKTLAMVNSVEGMLYPAVETLWWP